MLCYLYTLYLCSQIDVVPTFEQARYRSYLATAGQGRPQGSIVEDLYQLLCGDLLEVVDNSSGST